jgi:hypothetical protein
MQLLQEQRLLPSSIAAAVLELRDLSILALPNLAGSCGCADLYVTEPFLIIVHRLFVVLPMSLVLLHLHDAVWCRCVCLEVRRTLEKGSGRSCEQYGVLLAMALYQMALNLLVASYASSRI